jgi:aldose 1-epimerase
MVRPAQAALIAVVLAAAGEAGAAEAVRGVFGKLPDGATVEQVELSNGKGVKARIITLGATIQALETPDRDGRSADIVLGYDTPAEYLKGSSYFGATVGRFANRIAGGAFSLDGHRYVLPLNNGPNTLHGGNVGFDKHIWTITKVASGPRASVTLAYVSPDGDQGFPGAVKVEATYALDDKGELSLEYTATTDKPTIVNLSNHSYFNLAGVYSGESATDVRLTLDADAYTPVDEHLIPTGEVRPVAGTAFDFRAPSPVDPHLRDGKEPQIIIGKGVDHNFVLRGRAGEVRRAVRVEDPRTGRVLEILTDQPAVQVYTGNFLDGKSTGKGGRAYRQGDALVFEPQVYPDAPNHPDFPSARLDPGQTYRNRIVYRFSTTAP